VLYVLQLNEKERIMERLPNGKIKIVGKAPSSQVSASNRRYGSAAYLWDMKQRGLDVEEYFNTIFDGQSSFDSIEWDVLKLSGSVSPSVVCGRKILNLPKAKIIQKVELDGPFAVTRVRSSSRYLVIRKEHLVFADTAPRAQKESVITFKYDKKRSNGAVFYVADKVLITSDLLSGSRPSLYLEKTVQWLIDNGHISKKIIPVTKEEGDPEAAYKKITEIHSGMKISVKVKLPLRTVTVGCDPEFEVLSNGRPVNPPRKYYGIDKEIGLDGAGSQLEIRPKSAPTVREVIQNIKSLIATVPEPLSTVGNTYAVGGHIHIGVGHEYAPTNDLLFLLDYFLGKPTINLSGTARSHYKELGKFETKPWGFEYRSCPAAIFETPEFARLAMKICKFVTACYINGQVILINPTPQFEDYWNYGHLTPKEYELWLKHIDDYKELMRRPNRYDHDTVCNWVKTRIVPVPRTVPEETQEPQPGTYEERTFRAQAIRTTLSEQEAGQVERTARATRIGFSDDWEDAVREDFRSTISANVPEGTRVNIFGLGEVRGMATYGYNVEGCVRIGGVWSGFGVPRAVRMGEVSHEGHIVGIIAELLREVIIQPVVINEETREVR
jgi:hypothetical protein